MKEVIVAGKVLLLRLMDKSELKGIFVDALLGYSFYEAIFQENHFLLMEAKRNKKLSPLQYQNMANRISEAKMLPCVFLFDSLATYERNRLIEKGVYFIVSNKYAYLPFLLINARASAEVKTTYLLPSAQYILLYHLQVNSLDGYTLSKLESRLPLKYVTLSRGVKQLEALNFIDCEVIDSRIKKLKFPLAKKYLWEVSEPLMQNPIKATYYLSQPPSDAWLSGINALAHYSNLNPEEHPTFALSEAEFKKQKAEYGLNILDGHEEDIRLEVWKYQPLAPAKPNIPNMPKVVDPLSLYLTLKDDPDPRVEKELEKITNALW